MRRKFFVGLTLLLAILLSACSQTSRLNPKKPITITLWHNFGGQMQTMMDEQIEEFNATVGKEKGIIISVTSISSSAALQEKLTMIAAGDPGAPEMPNITTCYPATAAVLADKGLIVPMDEHFTTEELMEYLPRFLTKVSFPTESFTFYPLLNPPKFFF